MRGEDGGDFLDHNSNLTVKKIKNGTVIDRIPPGRSFVTMRLLGIDENYEFSVSMVSRVKSQKLGLKDVLKISDRHIDEQEVPSLGLFIAGATVNWIQDYGVMSKLQVPIPDELRGVVRCANPNCVTNHHEPVLTKFAVTDSEPMTLRCKHCNWSVVGLERIEELLLL